MDSQKNLDLSRTEIDALARDRFGDPTQKLCRPHDLRFGTHGSVSVNRDTGAWYDHENRKGGWLQSPRGSTRQTTSTGRIVAEYDYLDADGSLLFQVCRLEPKTFRQRRPDGGGGWIWTIRGVTQVPYRLPEIAAAPQDATIFIVEGEKDADALARLGVVATCNAGGAGKWKANFGRYLTRRSVVILPDNDEAGEAHALDVAAKLSTYASAIRILRISNVPQKGDVWDWLAAGGTVEDLRAMAETAPLWEPGDYGAANTRADFVPPADEAKGLDVCWWQRIPVTPGGLSGLADAAERALIETGADIYQRAGCLVRPGFGEAEASDGSKTISACLNQIDSLVIRDELSARTGWIKVKGEGADTPIDPPLPVCATLLSRRGRWKFPNISGILTCPTLSRDGSIASAPGYDPQTGYYLALERGFSMPQIAENPTHENAVQALDILKNLLLEFPFITNADRSVALSLILSAVCRGALGVVPVHAFTAPTPGSGKSFVVDVASTIISGRPAPVIAAGSDETELEKRLAAKLFSGTFLISIDNFNGDLGGDLLCQIAERPLVSARVLGKSETPEIEFRGIVTANGNNLCVNGDLTRRLLLARLDPNTERPEGRLFLQTPVAAILADRGKYVAAALTIVRAYLAAGQPDRLPTLASYGLWSDRIRSALAWLGEADPVEAMAAARESDPVTADLRALLLSWREAFGSEELTAAEVVQRLQAFNTLRPDGEAMIALRQALDPVATTHGVLDARRLGYYLRRHSGRLIEKMRFAGNLDRKGTKKWLVEAAAA